MNDEFMLQVSGMEYAYNSSKPAGERLVSVKINGLPIDPFKIYSVTANEMVLGILDYVGITPVSIPNILVGITEFEALSNYVMAQNNFLTAKEIGRVLNVGDQKSFAGILGAGWMDIEPIEMDKHSSALNKLFFEFHIVDFGLNYQPKGKVNIRIPQLRVNLKSDFCEWLLVENSAATIRGTGKINNKGNYGFMLLAEDGAACKMGDDKLRVVIWDKNDGDKIIYDNLVSQATHGVISMSTNSIFAKETEESDLVVPTEFALEQNYPNPFNPTTTISYSIPEAGYVELKVYDILGNEVATLVNEAEESGYHTALFDATKLASGIYIYTLRTNNFVQTRKMMLLK
jgi:hypothetical protein